MLPWMQPAMLPAHAYSLHEPDLVAANLHNILDSHDVTRVPNHHPPGFHMGPLVVAVDIPPYNPPGAPMTLDGWEIFSCQCFGCLNDPDAQPLYIFVTSEPVSDLLSPDRAALRYQLQIFVNHRFQPAYLNASALVQDYCHTNHGRHMIFW